MPLGDGTGPRGLGPMTGRGAGFCTGFGRPGFTNPIPGRRFGFGGRMPYRYPYAGGYGYAAAPYMGYGYPYYGRGYTPPYGYPYGYPPR
jgi:hypothetical protein